ncbi:hypothetical protein I4U23_001772 [Adineta vaga]|nr:hypothetical protein I4U23_001772 [Adineta vaga]
MENTEAPIQTEESTAVVETVTDDTSKTNGESSISKDSLKMNGEQAVMNNDEPKTNGEEAITEDVSTKTTEEISVEKKEDEVVSSNKSINEQENVAETSTSVPPTCVSPGRPNIPLKEVNESEKEESAVISNGTDSTNSKKRELEQEDEPAEETTNDNDERPTDQTKKIKITEIVDTPIMETKESENNIIVNGNTAVEV